MARLKTGGFRLLDCQFQTEHLSQFGVAEIPKAAYLKRLKSAIDLKADFYDLPSTASGKDVMRLLGARP